MRETLDFELKYVGRGTILRWPKQKLCEANHLGSEGLGANGPKEDFLGDNRELCPKAGGALNNGRGRPAPSLYFLTAFAAWRRDRAPYTLARSLIAHSSHSLALPTNPPPTSPGPREAVRRRKFHTARILSGFECLNSRTRQPATVPADARFEHQLFQLYRTVCACAHNHLNNLLDDPTSTVSKLICYVNLRYLP